MVYSPRRIKMISANNKNQVNLYYQKRYRAEEKKTMRPLQAYSVFVNYLRLKKNTRLLDVACGTGYFLKIAELKGVKTFGIDYSSQAVKVARKISPSSYITRSAADKLPFKNNYFDYVTCLGSLQYFPDMDKVITEIKRVAKKNALFCFMVPNRNFIFWRLFGRNKKILWGIDKQILRFEDWCKLWQKHGLSIVNIYQDEWLKKTRILAKLFWWLIPFRYTYQYIFILKSRLNSSLLKD